MSPDHRVAFAQGLPWRIGNQVGQIFGPEFEHGEQHYQDWANEAFTCARRDCTTPAGEHNRRLLPPSALVVPA